MLEPGNRSISDRFPATLPAARRRAEMTDFYEELADFAAMSEDDGFLGQCAGVDADLPVLSTQLRTSGERWIAPARRGPQQLQLLVVLERTTRTF
jgi:hypothetical protein